VEPCVLNRRRRTSKGRGGVKTPAASSNGTRGNREAYHGTKPEKNGTHLAHQLGEREGEEERQPFSRRRLNGRIIATESARKGGRKAASPAAINEKNMGRGQTAFVEASARRGKSGRGKLPGKRSRNLGLTRNCYFARNHSPKKGRGGQREGSIMRGVI